MGIIFLFLGFVVIGVSFYWLEKKKPEKSFRKDFFWTFCCGSFYKSPVQLLIILPLYFVLSFYFSMFKEINNFEMIIGLFTLIPLWAISLYKDIQNSETICKDVFARKVTKNLQCIKDHFLVIGYGRFGKTVISDMFESYGELEKSSFVHKLRKFAKKEDKKNKPILNLRKMINEQCEQVLFCTNLLIMDYDESFFSCIVQDQTYGKVGFVLLKKLDSLKYCEDENKNIYVPAIIGNARNTSNLNLCNITNCKIVLSLIPDNTAIDRIFTAIKELTNEKTGIICLTHTMQGAYLIPQSYDTNIGFIHGYKIRGRTIGKIAYSNLEKLSWNNTSKDKGKPILILGQGKQIHFILERIWLELGGTQEDIECLRDNCLIVGLDEYIIKSKRIYKNKTYWNHIFSYKGKGMSKNEEYNVFIPYLEAYSDEPSILAPIISGKVDITTEPFSRIDEKVLHTPAVIIITSDSWEEILMIFNEVNCVLERYKKEIIESKKSIPVVVIESNPLIAKTVVSAMEYYARLLDDQLKNDTYPTVYCDKPQPLRYSDNIVGSFSESNKLLRGYVEAMCRKFGASLRICIRDEPGAFAKLCFLLSNLTIQKEKIGKPQGNFIPSFHGSYSLKETCNSFCFFSNAELREGYDKPIPISKDSRNIHKCFVSTKYKTVRNRIINTPNSLIPEEGVGEFCGNCPRLSSCPLIEYQKSIDSKRGSLQAFSEAVKSFWKNEKAKEQEDCYIPGAKRAYNNCANFLTCGYLSQEPTTLAISLYKFLLLDNPDCITIPDKCTDDTISPLFDIKYVRNAECYNPEFELMRIYGNLESKNHPFGERRCIEEVFSKCIQAIVISPTKDDNLCWLEYANNFCNYANKWLEKFTKDETLELNEFDRFQAYGSFVCKGESKSLTDILIITKSYKHLLIKEYLQTFFEDMSNRISKNDSSERLDKGKLLCQINGIFGDKKGMPLKNNTIEGFMNKSYLEDKKSLMVGLVLRNFLKSMSIEDAFVSSGKFRKDQCDKCPVRIEKCILKNKAIKILSEGQEIALDN